MQIKIIIVTPAGRQQYMNYLVNHLIMQKQYFHEWHLWNNCRNINDEVYIYELAKKYSWIKVINDTDDKYMNNLLRINTFYKYASDSNTIYIKLDDDIVWLSPNFISSMVQFKLKHISTPIVMANIVNNNYIDHLHQKTGRVLQSIEPIEKDCMGNMWKSSEKTLKLHEEFKKDRLNNSYDKWIIDDHVVSTFERVSINAIAWQGELIQNNDLGMNIDEVWASMILPRKYNKPLIINGNAIALHFAFGIQRETLMKNNLYLDDKLKELME